LPSFLFYGTKVRISEERTKEKFIYHKSAFVSPRFGVFFVTLEEIAGFFYIKAVWRIEEIAGYDLETVLNSTFCYKLHSMNTRLKATSLFHGSSSGAKVRRIIEITKL
jgi:hypothetical protein